MLKVRWGLLQRIRKVRVGNKMPVDCLLLLLLCWLQIHYQTTFFQAAAVCFSFYAVNWWQLREFDVFDGKKGGKSAFLDIKKHPWNLVVNYILGFKLEARIEICVDEFPSGCMWSCCWRCRNIWVCSKEAQKVRLRLRSFCVLVPPVKLCDGPASLHLQEVLHAGLWSGATVHQHQRRSPTGKKCRHWTFPRQHFFLKLQFTAGM